MSNYEEIKNLIEASRRALSKNINESSKSQIRRQYGLLNEQMTEKVDFETENENEPKKIRMKLENKKINKRLIKSKEILLFYMENLSQTSN